MTDLSDITLFVEQFRRVHGHSPTQAEIADHFGVSRTVIRKRIARLVAAGELEWPTGTRRTIRQADMKGRSVEL